MQHYGKNNDENLETRRKFVEAYNDTQVRIWKDRIRILKAVDTGSLLRSPLPGLKLYNDDISDVRLSQSFLDYGIWVNFGVGREMPAGKRLPEGSSPRRRAKRWFDRSFYRSVANLRDFMAESFGRSAVGLVANALSDANLKRIARGLQLH